MTRRSKEIFVTLRFNDGITRVIGPINVHDGGRLYRMAERNMRAMDLKSCGWHDADYYINHPPLTSRVMSHDA